MKGELRLRGIVTVLMVSALVCMPMVGKAMAADLELDDQQGQLGDTVTFTMSVNNAPNDVASLGIDIGFNQNVLEYSSADFAGTLMEPWSFKQVSNPEPGFLRLGGFTVGGEITAGSGGALVRLTFTVVGDQDCQLPLSDLKDDIGGWTTKDGSFIYVEFAIEPSSVTICAGASSKFTIVPEGIGEPPFIWRVDDEIAQTGDSRTFEYMFMEAGEYTISVEDSSVPALSAQATATVLDEDDSGALDIMGGSGPAGATVTIGIRIQNAPNEVASLGFEVTYDPNVLIYPEEPEEEEDWARGDLVQDFDFFGVNWIEPGLLRIGGFEAADDKIAAGASGIVVELTFEVAEIENCICSFLDLQELKDHIATWSASAACFLANCNQPPIADAGPNQTVDEGVEVTLDGSNSHDPDGTIVSYLWTQTCGTPVELGDPTAVKPTFTAPEVVCGEALCFQLAVTDDGGLQDDDNCIVNVTDLNHPPTADAGPDQTVDERDTVTLDGSNSSDPDPGDSIASYLWTQTEGTPVTLDDPTAVQPTFTAPDAVLCGEALTFRLTVTDTCGLQDDDTCIVNVTDLNQPPVADAGPDQEVDEGVTVTLDGSNSSDPDAGDSIGSYLWTQTGGTSVTLDDPTAKKPTFVALPVDINGTTLTFQLTVEDNCGLKARDEVSVTINDNGITGFPEDVITFISSTGEDMGIKEESGGNCVSLSAIDPSTIADTTNRPDDLIYGLIDMQIKVDSAGGTASVTIYLPEPAPDGYKWFKYGPNKGWYDYSDYAVFNAARDQVTLTLIDGGIGDDDGVVNGMIMDPSGLATAPVEQPEVPTGDGGGGGGCFIATVAFDSSMEPLDEN